MFDKRPNPVEAAKAEEASSHIVCSNKLKKKESKTIMFHIIHVNGLQIMISHLHLFINLHHFTKYLRLASVSLCIFLIKAHNCVFDFLQQKFSFLILLLLLFHYFMGKKETIMRSTAFYSAHSFHFWCWNRNDASLWLGCCIENFNYFIIFLLFNLHCSLCFVSLHFYSNYYGRVLQIRMGTS